ncbi:leucine--tRNA ligase [Nocardia macrotermitis]|uniref:Leucine--tRNA ligase n=1 Tax=Nocardia macrotermitis TaxID=2585198 RepID=A0A7K0D3J5_9NOCA|nr:leucine--tRNA ligase [Nocardia macrotermitis]MQY20306.1 Leucine--tRNA ligase [Nocardia macrotermitis]
MTAVEPPNSDEIYDPQAVIDKWLAVWDELGTFEVDRTDNEPDRPRRYVVSMFAYPSGDLHMGHGEVFSISDAIARFARMRGAETLFPVGWDSFGLPAENAAFKRGLDPREWTYTNIETQADSFRRLGISFDWRTRLHTSDPEYYRWNQWLFLRLFERGLAYRDDAMVNWCPQDRTVLANEQVVSGRCERCGAEVVKRALTQWFFRISAYAQRLLDDMDRIEPGWPPEILTMQRNWIGRSEGAHIDFAIEGRDEPVRIFTTRPETLFGATFFVIAFDAPLAAQLCAPECRAAFETYVRQVSASTDIERLATDRPKTGVFLGRYAINPATGERIPVYAADYVLATYGTGAVMAVPAHDQRDLDFARTQGIPVQTVIDTGAADPARTGVATDGAGVLISSGRFTGQSDTEARAAIVADLTERGIGASAVTYRLRDWLLSRQRYWGTPIPIIHCDDCGQVPVPDDQLPVRLPESGYDLRPDDGRAPLASAHEWVRVPCPRCGITARRDTDTMDTFVDSSWYFLRYPNPDFTQGPFDPAEIARWLPVDEYIGGKEHATGHLLYARFLTKVLHDLGLLPFTEPMTRLTNQGQVLMDGKAMSKSLGNLVDLRSQIRQYGPDAVRVTMIFAGPPEDDIDWADVSPQGAVKWLARIWRLAVDIGSAAGTSEPTSNSATLRRDVHATIAETTALMTGKRLNVAVAQLMRLTNLLRKAVDTGPGPADPAVREGVEALVRMSSCFAPFTAEESWERLGHNPSVSDAGWPTPDPSLLAHDTTTCVIQIDGKLRDRLQVPVDIDETALRALALASATITDALAGRATTRVIVRAPRLVNLVTKHGR